MAAHLNRLIVIALFFANFTYLAQSTAVPPDKVVAYDVHKKYTVEQLQFDLAILKDALLKCHPGLFWHQNQETFEANYLQLKNGIKQPMTELEFYSLITPFIGSLKCDHTNLEMSEPFYNLDNNTVKVFPFVLKVMDAKVYLHYNCSDDISLKAGYEVLAINGRDADSILQFVKPRSWADGFVESYSYLNIESSFTPLFLSFFNQASTYSLTLKLPNGSITHVNAEAVTYKRFKQRYDQFQTVKLSEEHPHFSFKIVDSLNTAVLKINAFEGEGYFTFLNKSFETLNQKKIGHLIIDLRGNSGGEGSYTGPLYRRISLQPYLEIREVEMKISNPEDSIFAYGALPEGKKSFVKFYKKYIYQSKDGRYLMKYGPMDDFQEKPFPPRKDCYRGKVYFITDVQTSSGGSQLSVLAHYHKRAQFIGRETGGGYLGNTSGWDFPLTLPHSKIIVHIPLISTYNAVTGPAHRGVMPDFLINENVEDLILNKDTEMLFTLDLISKSKL